MIHNLQGNDTTVFSPTDFSSAILDFWWCVARKDVSHVMGRPSWLLHTCTANQLLKCSINKCWVNIKLILAANSVEAIALASFVYWVSWDEVLWHLGWQGWVWNWALVCYGALHPKDPNYVEVTVKRHRQHCKLGHVKATLLSGCLHCLPDHLQSRGKQYD